MMTSSEHIPPRIEPNKVTQENVYTYREAINLAGNGWYSISLLSSLSISSLAMFFDMFGFSVVVNGAACDLHLTMRQTTILLSTCFIGPIVMAYPWGYISDTQGRRKSLLIALWGSFLVATASAFSTNWTMLAVLKFISTSLCSCIQSASYTLLGECTSEKNRDAYMLIMTSVLDFCLAAYFAIGYYILNLNFFIEIGVIYFTPWRLLIIIMALPFGIGALTTHFFYESPKFLINVGREVEAVECLRGIWRRNNGEGEKYPVNKVILDEEGNNCEEGVSFLKSLWNQIVPLFKPPLLWRSLQLYFCTVVVFGTNTSYFVWFSFIAEQFTSGMNSLNKGDIESGICGVIVNNVNATSYLPVQTCSSKMHINVVYSSLIQGASFVFLMMVISKLSHKKKLLQILILIISCLSAAGAGVVKNNIISAVLFLGLLANELCIGIIFTYFVELYPTSYRGMASCIGVMVARASSLGGVNLLGTYIRTKCNEMFYLSSVLLFVAVCVSLLLPSDNKKQDSKENNRTI